jgi:hypothetical protein
LVVAYRDLNEVSKLSPGEEKDLWRKSVNAPIGESLELFSELSLPS